MSFWVVTIWVLYFFFFTIWVFSVLSQFEFCQDLSFWVLSQLEFLSLVIIWVLSQLDFKLSQFEFLSFFATLDMALDQIACLLFILDCSNPTHHRLPGRWPAPGWTALWDSSNWAPSRPAAAWGWRWRPPGAGRGQGARGTTSNWSRYEASSQFYEKRFICIVYVALSNPGFMHF